MAIGGQALIASNGGFNTAVGVQTGTELTSGTNNTLLLVLAHKLQLQTLLMRLLFGNDDIITTTLKGTVEAPFLQR